MAAESPAIAAPEGNLESETQGDLVTFVVEWADGDDAPGEPPAGEDKGKALPDEILPDMELKMQALADAISRMKPTRPEIVRAVPIGRVLAGFGRPLRRSEGDFYGLSKQAGEIQAFWSHSWQGPPWKKILALIFLYNSTAASVLSTAAAVCVIPLYVFQVLPSFVSSSVWCSLVGSVTYLLTLFFWRRPSQTAFVDRCCIHQSDPRLKAEGVFSLGAIIKSSEQLVVLWDWSYAQRLWCIFEMAAFLHTHKGQERVRIQPTIFGPLLLSTSLSFMLLNLGILGMYNVAGQNSFMIFVLVTIFFSSLIFAPLASWPRQYFREVGHIRTQIVDFSIEKSEAYCCSVGHKDPHTGTPMPCDRKIIQECVIRWFGSIGAFHDRVRGDVQQALLDRMTSQVLSYKVFVEVSCPIFWPFLDFFAAYVRWALAEDMTMGYVSRSGLETWECCKLFL
ncbi:unnamed protein product [Symbiodinium sp. CCMP2592]|nr:unnamed protein product [Symbiodinium sp. CCMP2592]